MSNASTLPRPLHPQIILPDLAQITLRHHTTFRQSPRLGLQDAAKGNTVLAHYLRQKIVKTRGFVSAENTQVA